MKKDRAKEIKFTLKDKFSSDVKVVFKSAYLAI